ncbi:rRNA small subunit methyltransferase I [Rubellimicrobium mesophilum DSM 19309]|uniref:Ribosomal RNA small subunit methyltransferase I n=1 Tax=Rubellimicrobium mesophilum DSM 19309 TaxID=442562 RepID=A0A017HJN4_9RHOB|nr:16S rRNA (cytidine(1402)-2'-O)-methyltransferase [Rubellimicrobium mesophilum]EYD73994.1 rRNA small subunit methyltransferase I [Rubellimicrobium mesophilum DSM 19309]
MNDARTPLSAGLTLAATPIGAARDITLRTLDLLRDADIIAAEDTRTARKLMEIHGVPLNGRRLVACHDHSGEGVVQGLVEAIAGGASVVYVSEAGTPLVSDPGFTLARAAIARGLPVTAAPGPSALLAALAVAGLPADRFLFAGFLPTTESARRAALAELAPVQATLVFYESPKRLNALLTDLVAVLGEREAAICRELTKRFEEVRRGTLGQLLASLEGEVKGEVVVVVGRGTPREATEEDIRARLADAMGSMRLKDAATAVAGALGLPRQRVYQLALGMKEERDG